MARPPVTGSSSATKSVASSIERVARAEKLPFQDVHRARIVLYAAEGVADTEIASRLDASARVWSGVGDDDSPNIASKDCAVSRGRVGRAIFPPQPVAEVKAIACELPRSMSWRCRASRGSSCTAWSSNARDRGVRVDDLTLAA